MHMSAVDRRSEVRVNMSTTQGKVGIGICSSVCVFTILVGIVSGSFFAGCGLTPALGMNTRMGTGKLKVLIADTPLPLKYAKAATVTITRVEVRRMDKETSIVDKNALAVRTGSETANREEGDWIVVQQGEQIINLTELRNEQASLLASASVSPGRYSQVRLICVKGSVTVTDSQPGSQDRVFPLAVPGGVKASLTLDSEFTVTTGNDTSLCIKVDLNQAIRPIPSGEVTNLRTIEGFQFIPSAAMMSAEVVRAG